MTFQACVRVHPLANEALELEALVSHSKQAMWESPRKLARAERRLATFDFEHLTACATNQLR